MQRYDIQLPSDCHASYEPLFESNDGDYVLYSDAESEIAAAEQRGAERERKKIEVWLAGQFYSHLALEVSRGDHHAHGREAQP